MNQTPVIIMIRFPACAGWKASVNSGQQPEKLKPTLEPSPIGLPDCYRPANKAHTFGEGFSYRRTMNRTMSATPRNGNIQTTKATSRPTGNNDGQSFSRWLADCPTGDKEPSVSLAITLPTEEWILLQEAARKNGESLSWAASHLIKAGLPEWANQDYAI